MATAVETSFNSLQDELEKAKENLKSVDENIKKLTGRVPYENRLSTQSIRRNVGNLVARGPGRPPGFGPGDRLRDNDGPPAKRRTLTVFSRLEGRNRHRSKDDESGEEDELPTKPTVQSSVVAYPKEQKTRKDCIEEQKPDEKGLARNRRMFGLLMGTLQKFRVEEQKKQHKEQKRVEIERKLEDKVEREREDLKKERKELFLERRKRQAELRRLEYKMELAKQLEEWVQNRRKLTNFICTKSSPKIYYLPAKHNDVTLNLLQESKKSIEEGIEILRKTVEEEIDNVGKRRAVAVDNELELDGGGGDEQVRGLGYEASQGEASLDPALNSDAQMNLEGQEDIMGENYEESKGSFPMLIPMDQTNINENESLNPQQTTADAENSILMEENCQTEEIANGDEQQSIPLVKCEETSVDKREINDEQEIDSIDLNKLAEKEFEPIYD